MNDLFVCLFVDSELQKYGEADVVTYHTLMYGYFLRGNYPRVLQLYQEALINEIDVRSPF